MRWKRFVARILVLPTIVSLIGPLWIFAAIITTTIEWLDSLNWPSRVVDWCDRVEKWSRK